MKLKKLVVNNFRNYIGEVSFDLSKDITILYGDNGNGKSSFFDAIEWCITGEINRFTLMKNEYKTVVANSSMCLGDECSVAIYFDNYILKKSFKKNDMDIYSPISTSLYTNKLIKIALGEKNVNEKLAEIISKNGNGKWDSKVLSRAYILSQTQINNFITKDTPQERYKALASIMGFEKINNLKNNLSRTHEVLLTKVNSLLEKLEEVRGNKENEQKKIDLGITKLNISSEELKEKINIDLYSKKLSMIKNELSEITSANKALLKVNLFDQENELQFTNLIMETSLKIEEIEELNQKKNIEKNEMKLKIEKFTKDKIEIIKEEKILSKYKSSQKDASNLLIELRNNDKDYDKKLTQKLNMQINKVDSLLPEIKYSYENLDIYVESKKLLEVRHSEIEKLKVESKDSEKKIQQIQKDIKKLLSDFSEGVVSTNIEKLLSLVENTQSFISSSSDYKNICPVCDSHVDNIDIILDKKIVNIISESGKHKKIIELNIEKRKEFEIKQKKLLDRQIEIDTLIKSKEQLIIVIRYYIYLTLLEMKRQKKFLINFELFYMIFSVSEEVKCKLF